MRLFRYLNSLFKRSDLLNMNGYFEIWKVAYPLIIMSASLTLMQFADRAFLASNSTEDVTAALPAGILYFTSFCFFMVTTNFTSAIVAQFWGAKNVKGCVQAAWNGFYFSLCASLIIVYILPYLGDFAIRLGGHAPEIMERELIYYNALIPSGAFTCIGAAFFSFFSGRGKTSYIAIVNSFACVLNIGLDYALIFGKLGLPALGIWGAGVATSLSTMFSCICAFVLFLGTNQIKFPTRKFKQFRFDFIKRLFSFGTPAGLQSLFDVGAFTMVSFLIGTVSTEALASTTIALSITQLSFLPLLGFADATSIVCGQFIGSAQHRQASLVALRSWRMAIGYMLMMGCMYLLIPEVLISIFSPSSEGDIDFTNVLKTGRFLLGLAAAFNLFDATKFIFMGALRGAGDTRAILLISSTCAWGLMVPGTLLLIFKLKCSVETVWVFLAFCICVESLIMFGRFKCNRWRKIDLIGQKKD